ncbi:MAG: type III-B CRISPR module RAMP protein Cmr1 [Crenarchaeota archaeon]|nr:type III-B CRISPR module RAMP protein Cmr1 [Thermoproteota archaeon]
MSTLLLELKLINETPLFLGSYDAQFNPEDAFRTQSLKGLWRWWTRALIGGVLYDSGSRGSDLIRKTINLTGELFGSTDKCSMFKIVSVYKLDRSKIKICKRRSRGGLCELQRVTLLTLNRDITFVDSNGLEVDLKIYQYRRGRDHGIELGLLSLIVGLSLSGLGKMSRRCVGTFKIYGRDHVGIVGQYLKGTLGPEDLKKLIEHAYNAAARYCQTSPRKLTVSSRDLPPFPSISKSIINCSNIINRVLCTRFNIPLPSALSNNTFPIACIYYIPCRLSIDTLLILQDFFMRARRIIRYYGRNRPPHWFDLFRIRLGRDEICKAWILGLPRYQKGAGRGTGYFTNVDRRASPFIVSSHGDHSMLTLLVSSDWPDTIDWRGEHSRTRIRVTSEEVLINSVDGLAYFESYVQKTLRTRMVRIWP